MAWDIIPVGIDNILGGSPHVVLPFWFALTSARQPHRETDPVG